MKGIVTYPAVFEKTRTLAGWNCCATQMEKASAKRVRIRTSTAIDECSKPQSFVHRVQVNRLPQQTTRPRTAVGNMMASEVEAS